MSASAVGYTEGFAALRDARIEQVIATMRASIGRDAAAVQSTQPVFERQLRLHLPSPDCKISSSPSVAYNSVAPIVAARAYRISHSHYLANMRADYFGVSSDLKIDRCGTVARNDEKLKIDIRSVPPSIGHEYQSKIHYLLSPRADTLFQFGAFEAGADYPLLYVGLSRCDRTYHINLARELTSTAEMQPLILTRMVGVADLPKNLVSYTIARIAEKLVVLGQHGILFTAVNPLLGFSGASMLASNFIPFGLLRVDYRYERTGEFVNNRIASPLARKTTADWPPNVVLGRPIDMKSPIASRLRCMQETPFRDLKILDKAQSSSPSAPKELLSILSKFREVLERGWCRETMHPDFAEDYIDGQPTGQCGVSSVWLARKLRADFSMQSTYCYGELSFDRNDISPVKRHCWIEIGEERSSNRIIVDLTADQAVGFDQRVIIQRAHQLEGDGIRYQARARKNLDELTQDAVWDRFIVLSQKIDGYYNEAA
ncbi:hypothetical protein [Nocardia sp. NPDC049149]|uniref:hypothetical protein n=1 Tax=Nocardia sp. NPDC049149 TaxID=3364315 RepID=UPI0037123A04